MSDEPSLQNGTRPEDTIPGLGQNSCAETVKKNNNGKPFWNQRNQPKWNRGIPVLYMLSEPPQNVYTECPTVPI